MKNYALIFAGGVGSRMNNKSMPKQFLEIHNKPIIIHTIEHFELHPEIDSICVVIVADWLDYMKTLVNKFNLKKVKWIIPGGNSALESQYFGLSTIETVASKEDIVLIHDGVRPLINKELITDCIRDARLYGSAVTVAPAIETIIRSDDQNFIISTLPREECQLARAPQTFYVKEILSVHKQAMTDENYNFVDSTSLLLHYGKKIHTVEGPSKNIKVTNPEDFYICKALLDVLDNE